MAFDHRSDTVTSLRTAWIAGVMWGVLAHSLLLSFFQDIIGLEKYITHVRATWVTINPTFWGVCLFLVVTSGVLTYRRYGQIQEFVNFAVDQMRTVFARLDHERSQARQEDNTLN